jgi:hypothetical protein
VHAWLDQLVTFEPGHESERIAWIFCLAHLARRTGQRALDIDDEHRDSVAGKLKAAGAAADSIQMVEEVMEMGGEEQRQLFGESLPFGLKLVETQ